MRVKTFGFSYSDIFANHLAIYLNGGDCTEDVNDHFREHLQNVRGMQVCSADTILRGVKELATDTLFLENHDSVVKHEFNLNPRLNDLLVKGLKQTGQLKRHKRYDLDYDNQVQPTENTMPKGLTKRPTVTNRVLPPSTTCRYTLKTGTGTARQNIFKKKPLKGHFQVWRATV